MIKAFKTFFSKLQRAMLKCRAQLSIQEYYMRVWGRMDALENMKKPYKIETKKCCSLNSGKQASKRIEGDCISSIITQLSIIKFHLISWCENFVERQSFRKVSTPGNQAKSRYFTLCMATNLKEPPQRFKLRSKHASPQCAPATPPYFCWGRGGGG